MQRYLKGCCKEKRTHANYVNTLETNKILSKTVTSLKSFDRHLEEKTESTPFYDKMVMEDKINCHPFGYGPE